MFHHNQTIELKSHFCESHLCKSDFFHFSHFRATKHALKEKLFYFFAIWFAKMENEKGKQTSNM